MTDDATTYAETRLATMVQHGWVTDDRNLLLEDIRLVLSDLARLRTDLEGARAALADARAGLAAERRAREIAEARLYAYGDHQPHCPHPRGACACGYAIIGQTPPPFLAELDAARAFIRAISGAMLIGGWSDEQSRLLAAWDEARKGREG